MVLVLNVLLALGQKLTHQINAMLVTMAIPQLLVLKLPLTVKPVIRRMLDASLVLQLKLQNVQNALPVIL